MKATSQIEKLPRSTKLKVDQWRDLSAQDNLLQTLGCRHSSPDICRNHSTPGKCAFVRKDQLCLLPPRSWKGIYQRLKERQLSG
jgi:hypothetical protein